MKTNSWRVVALLAILAFVAAVGWALRLMSERRDPVDALKEELLDSTHARAFVERGAPSFYVKIGTIGEMARRGDVDAMRALITVSEFARSGHGRDFLSYWLTEAAASRPELFLAVCSRMGEDAAHAVKLLSLGIVHYGRPAREQPVPAALAEASGEIEATSRWIGKEVKKARRVEARKEAEKDPDGSG